MSETSEITAAQYAERAIALNSFGKVPEAIVELRRGLTSYPDDPELLSLLCLLEFSKGDAKAGVQAARAALAVRPNDYRATTVLLDHAVNEERFDEARDLAEQQIATYPDYGPCFLNRAHVILNVSYAANRAGTSTKEKREAWGLEIAEATRKGISLDPEGKDSLRRATLLLSNINLHAEAVETLDRALALYPNDESLQLLASELKAKDDAEESKILLGVLAENPQQLGAARKLNANIWGRVQYLSAVVPWMLTMLMIVMAFIPDMGTGMSNRTERQFVQVFILVPFAALFGVVRFKVKALPKGYMRRMFNRVWWVWISFILLGLSSALMLLVSLAVVMRMQPATMEHSGPYMGGLAAFVGFVAFVAVLAELLVLWARFRSETRNRLYPIGEDSAAATKQDLKEARWSLIRVGAGLLLVLVPVIASGIVSRPETLAGFITVGVALMAPPLIRVTWLFSRLAHVSTQSASAITLGIIAGVLSIAAIVGTFWLFYQHLLQNDPPPTPWELELQEQRERWNDVGKLDIPDLSDLEFTVPEITPESFDPEAP